MRVRLLALVLLAVALTGCGVVTPEPAGEQLDAAVVSHDPDAELGPGTQAIGDAPIDPRVAVGWQAADRGNYWRPPEPTDSDDPEIPDRPGRTYVLVAGSTGCRSSESAELWRDGDDLSVRFTGGGKGPEECARPYNALAQFEVDTAAVAGTRTMHGRPLLSGAGPGTRTAFLGLGTLRHDAMPINPAELTGTTPQTMYAALRRGGARNLEQARAALLHKPAAGDRSFAFVLRGCQETGASLFLSRTYVTARLTGGNGTVCDAAQYFLVVYELPARLIPPDAKPT